MTYFIQFKGKDEESFETINYIMSLMQPFTLVSDHKLCQLAADPNEEDVNCLEWSKYEVCQSNTSQFWDVVAKEDLHFNTSEGDEGL